MRERFSINDNLEDVINAANQLEINYRRRPKADVVSDINAALDKMDEEAATVKINMITATDILTETELHILETLVNKVKEYELNQAIEEEMENQMKRLFGDHPFLSPLLVGSGTFLNQNFIKDFTNSKHFSFKL